MMRTPLHAIIPDLQKKCLHLHHSWGVCQLSWTQIKSHNSQVHFEKKLRLTILYFCLVFQIHNWSRSLWCVWEGIVSPIYLIIFKFINLILYFYIGVEGNTVWIVASDISVLKNLTKKIGQTWIEQQISLFTVKIFHGQRISLQLWYPLLGKLVVLHNYLVLW